MTSVSITILCFTVGIAAVVSGLFVAFARADRRHIAAFGAQRGWRLKRVWCFPFSVGLGRWGGKKSYYRATFVTSNATEEKLWFESTFRTDPIVSAGPLAWFK